MMQNIPPGRRSETGEKTYEDKSVGVVMHLAPTFSQKEHEGFLLSHLVRRARHT